jgi:undecaprenyl-diphosphatase
LGLDILATSWVNSLAGAWKPLDVAFVAVTTAGVPLVVLAVALQWWPRADRSSERHVAIACGLSFLVGLALNQLILLFADRLRPYDAGVTHLLIAPSLDPSFPSDHSTAVFSIAFAYLLHKRWLRAVVFIVAGSFVVFSRVYVGTHYVGDILGGMLTAFIAASIVRTAYPQGTTIDRWVTSIL